MSCAVIGGYPGAADAGEACPLTMNDTIMNQLERLDSSYCTGRTYVNPLARRFPAPVFYWKFLGVVFRASAKAKKGQYHGPAWCGSSFAIRQALESVGCKFEISGVEHIAQLTTPCVVIANHMSVMETTILPGIIQPHRKVTFVIKESLLHYPVFKHVMRSRRPIVVNRVNPRQDLKTVLAEGRERLHRGISIVVFPQTTRSHTFDPGRFNSLGVKLALKSEVPVVPLALYTAAWGNGKWVKEFGKIDPSRKIRFAFGRPLHVEGRGAREHQAVIKFIGEKLAAWQKTD